MALSGVVAFLGLDELSLDIASLLLRAGYKVQGFESNELSVRTRFLELGGEQCANPMEAARGASTLIVAIPEEGLSDALFGNDSAVKGLSKGAVIVFLSTISPSLLSKLERSARDELGFECFLDAFVFEGVSVAFKNKIIVIASGSQEALHRVQPVFSVISEKVYVLEGELGTASKVRAVNCLLEGIHLAAALEALFLGVQAGIHPTILYDIISNAAGSSWIFVYAIPKLLTNANNFVNCFRTYGNNAECINLGVRKFNVNTEVRMAYLESLRKPNNDLLHVMASAKEAMKAVIIEKMQLFGSSGKAR